MEKPLEKIMSDTMSNKGVVGCIFSNIQGLCLGAKGEVSTDSSGMILAIADQADKLEPQSRSPVIQFSSDNKSCIIKKHGPITGAIFKSNEA